VEESAILVSGDVCLGVDKWSGSVSTELNIKPDPVFYTSMIVP